MGPGDTVAGRYRVVAFIGEGGAGQVWEVEHTELKTSFALKRLRPELASSELRERFLREARTAARLDHPGLVRVFDFGSDDEGGPFMVMERLTGRTLSHHLAGGAPWTVTGPWLMAVLEAAAHAHERGVIHRDLKPDNIVITESGPKILDFGLARAFDAGEVSLTREGTVFGTPRYMSPEQAAGERSDHRADLYAMGIMLFEAISGRVPFDGDRVNDVLAKQITAPVPPLESEQLGPDTLARLRPIVERALAKDPDDRYPSAEALRLALADSGVVPSAEVSSAGVPAAGSRKREPAAPAVRRSRPRSRWLSPTLGAGFAIGLGWVLAISALRPSPRSDPLAPLRERVEQGAWEEAARQVQALEADGEPSAELRALKARIAAAEGAWERAAELLVLAGAADPSVLDDPGLGEALVTWGRDDDDDNDAVVRAALGAAGPGSGSWLEPLALKARSFGLRREVYEAMERAGIADRLDQFEYLASQLERNGTNHCPLRRWYVSRLMELDSERAQPILQAEIERRGGFLNLKRSGRCLHDLMPEAEDDDGTEAEIEPVPGPSPG